jgi:DGQHR domain-containing protein
MDLIKIANADIRKIHEEDRKTDSFDSYLGIQRKISPNRIKEIGSYVNTIDSTFPTSIILHVDSSVKLLDNKPLVEHELDFIEDNLHRVETTTNIIIDDIGKKLKIRSDEKVARILDGQHRIEGLRSGFENKASIPTYELNITIFVDLDLDDQAQIFSVINKAQTKVNKSLVYDLYEYAKTRSPQKTSHDIVRLLNRMPESPFYKKIKILGTAENKEMETLAQATFVELIQAYISKEPMKDRDDLKRKKIFGSNKLSLQTDEGDRRKWIFRNLFILEKDEIIMNIIWNFFKNVQDKWPLSWGNNTEGNILNKSTGLIALMKFLRPVVLSINKLDQVITYEDFKVIFDRIAIIDESFLKDNYIPGSSGQSQLLKILREKSGI